MATQTTRLLLRKPDPDPVTGDFIDVTQEINGNMDKLDAAAGVTICTSGTRPTGTDRWDGRQIYETDTRRNYVWSTAVTTWLPLLVGRSTDGPYLLGQSTDTSGEGINFRGTAAAAHGWRSRVTSDANPRFTIDADGALNWGGGSGAVDTKLYRSAADTLRTNDSFVVDGTLTVASVSFAGVPRGLVARGNRASAKTLITTEQGVLRLDNVALLNGRSYRFAVQGRPFSTVGSDTYRAHFRLNTSGTATTSSPEIKGLELTSHFSCNMWAYYAPAGNQTISLLYSLNRASGSGTFSSEGEPSGTELIIEDMGLAITDTGVDA